MSAVIGDTGTATDTRRFDRMTAALLMPVGPLAVAVLRFLIPFGPATTEAAADPARFDVILALGVIATFTLVPGAYAAVHLVRRYRPVLAAWVAALLIPGYLALAGVSAIDGIAAAGARLEVDSGAVSAIYDAVGALPALTVMFLVFLVGHIVGTVLLGILCFRSRLMPRPIAVLFAVSQPLHLTAVILENNWLDLFAWGLTAVGMTFLAVRTISTADDDWDLPPRGTIGTGS